MADPNPLAPIPLAEALANNMNESLQWMSRIWSSAGAGAGAGAAQSALASGLPSMMMPTLDPKELDKRISDLRSVQHWLDMNRALLHTTIQTLEMQRNGIVALQAMAASAQTGAVAAQRAAEASPAAAAGSQSSADTSPGAPPLPLNPAQWWSALSEQFARVASSAMAEASPASVAEPSPEQGAAPPAGDATRGPGQAPASTGARPGRKGSGQ